ncbi:MAG: ATP-binding protein [Candidatus Sericytochromatia bacterium]|nr:ATP-binding protein [Candidatus Sericytochromatia bacterium]
MSKKEEFSLKPKLFDGLLVLGADNQVLAHNRSLLQALSEVRAEEASPRLQAMLAEPAVMELIARARRDGEAPLLELVGPDWWPDRTLAVSAIQRGEETILSVHDWTDVYKLGTMQQDFVANVSHELRTPLTAIRMAAESLQMGAMRDERMRAKFLNNIQGEADRLTRLVNELLTVANLMGRPVLHMSSFDLQSLSEQVESTLQHHAKLASVTLLVNCPEEVPTIEADRDRLQQVLINLVDNAIKFTPASGTVTLDIGVAPGGSEVLCRVIDSGIGIPPIDLPRIFERFYRVDKARSRVTGGVGLGLSIVKDIIEAHHGKITVSSEVNRGTTFTIELPVKQPQTEPVALS